MNPFIIIPYSNAAHRSQVIALWKSVLNYDAPHNKPGFAIDKKIAADDGLFFVALLCNDVIGTVVAGYDGHRGWLYSVAVSPVHRRKRVGSQLVRVALLALAEKGCVKVNLQILEGNEAVIDFYKTLGFSVEKRVSMGIRIQENIPDS